jgi:hypothetical protein
MCFSAAEETSYREKLAASFDVVLAGRRIQEHTDRTNPEERKQKDVQLHRNRMQNQYPIASRDPTCRNLRRHRRTGSLQLIEAYNAIPASEYVDQSRRRPTFRSRLLKYIHHVHQCKSRLNKTYLRMVVVAA